MVATSVTPLTRLRRATLSETAYRRITLVALGLLCAIVLTGAAVRLTESGLGCSDWPNCEPGALIEMGTPNQAIEQVNRLFTGLVSVAVIAAVLGALKRRPFRRDLVRLSLGLVAGVVGQIVLGGITVLTDLHPVAVSGHFVLSMVLVVNATVLLWRSSRPDGPRQPIVGRTEVLLGRVAMVAGAAVVVVTGPLLTGSGPHAGDEAARRFDLAIPTAARIHSISAWIFCAAILVVIVRCQATDAPVGVQRRAGVLLAVVVVQGAIGYVQYELGIPPGVVLAHIAGACAVTIAATWFHLGLSAQHADTESVVPVGAGSAGA